MTGVPVVGRGLGIRERALGSARASSSNRKWALIPSTGWTLVQEPSEARVQASRSSWRLTRSTSSSRAWRPGSAIGMSASTRLLRVALHHVGRPDQVLDIVSAAESEDPGVFQVLADDRSNPDVLGHPGHAGNEAADPADDEVDLDARSRKPRTTRR